MLFVFAAVEKSPDHFGRVNGHLISGLWTGCLFGHQSSWGWIEVRRLSRVAIVEGLNRTAVIVVIDKLGSDVLSLSWPSWLLLHVYHLISDIEKTYVVRTFTANVNRHAMSILAIGSWLFSALSRRTSLSTLSLQCNQTPSVNTLRCWVITLCGYTTQLSTRLFSIHVMPNHSKHHESYNTAIYSLLLSYYIGMWRLIVSTYKLQPRRQSHSYRQSCPSKVTYKCNSNAGLFLNPHEETTNTLGTCISQHVFGYEQWM